MIIAIDGFAGAGKSTVAQLVAARLGFTYLDTGAMYRSVALLALERGVPPDQGPALGDLALGMDLRFQESAESVRVFAGDREVTEAIRTPAVSRTVSEVSAHHEVRHALTVRQRMIAESGNVVMEGRDTGTVVCPGADVKIYLTASPQERARRRQLQLEEQGIQVPLDTLERDLLARDSYDSGRALAPLRKAPEAIELDTTNMTIDEVVTFICAETTRAGEGRSRC